MTDSKSTPPPSAAYTALDARTGALLWRASLGGQIVLAPVTYQVEGRQYVSVIAGNTLVTFGLRDRAAIEGVRPGPRRNR